MTRPRLAAAVLVALLLAVLAWFLRGRGEPTAQVARPDAGGAAGATLAAPAAPGASRFARVDARRRGLVAELPRHPLRGKVVDGQGQPVEGALVVLAEPPRQSRSAADGTFAFDALTGGDYVVQASREAGLAGPVLVHLGPTTPPVTLRLYRALAAEIEVVSASDGRPIAGADVRLRTASMFEPAGQQRGVTGADGKVTFAGLPLAGHELFVSARGYSAASLGPDFVDRKGDRWKTRVELRPGDGVEGRVVDEQGRPIAGAVVEAVPYQEQYGGTGAQDEDRRAAELGGADPHTVRLRRLGPITGADGRFQLSLEHDGRAFVVVASHPAYQSAASAPQFPTGQREQHAVDLVLRRGARVAGLVATEQDEPVPGALVEVRWQAGGFKERTVQADGTGRFEIEGLPEAPLELVAVADGGRSARRPVDLRAPAPEHESLLLVLDLSGRISGVVVDARGAPVPDVTVTYAEVVPDARLSPRSYPAVETSGEDGRFLLRGVPRGVEVHVSAVRPQDGDFAVHEGWVRARAGDDVTIRMPEPGALTGRVVTTGGRAVAGVHVTDLPNGVSATTGPDGAFRLERVPPREYHLRVRGDGLAEAFAPPAIVRPGETTDVGEVRVLPGRRVAGVVRTPERRPAADATVTVTVDGAYRLRAEAGPDGRFELGAPEGAALVVTASHESGDAAAVKVAAGERATGLVLDVQLGGVIQGTATSEGKPAVNKVVAAWRAGPRAAEPARFGQCDDAGAYALVNVPPGTYDVELMLSEDGVDVRVYRQTVKVEVGKTVKLDFDAPDGLKGGEPPRAAEEPELPIYEAGGP